MAEKRPALRRARLLARESARRPRSQSPFRRARAPKTPRPVWGVDVIDGDATTKVTMPVVWTDFGVRAKLGDNWFWVNSGRAGVPYINKQRPIPGNPETAQGEGHVW